MYRIYLWANKLAVVTTIAIMILFSAGTALAEGDADTAAAASYNKAYGGVISVIPTCVLKDKLTPDCRNVTVFMALAVNTGRYLFSVVGALALGAFVYGGFLLILSEGKQDKVKKGADAMAAAAIGLLVAFGGYVFIRFLATSLGVNTVYQLPT